MNQAHKRRNISGAQVRNHESYDASRLEVAARGRNGKKRVVGNSGECATQPAQLTS